MIEGRVPDIMKTLLPLLGAALLMTGSLRAQEPVAEPEPMVAAAARFDASQLDQLLGPIALYPDALIALILPASTASSDVVLAARYLRDGGDVDQVENQPWDESVQALARYPDIVKWMDENLAWTQQLGEAFAAQPAEIMNAVQRLRARAQAAGTLVTTPQQNVVVEQNTISILPAQPDVIYIPYYDPEVVYVSRPAYYTTRVHFGPSYRTGFWLSYNLDWGARRVCVVNHSDRERYWREQRDWWRQPYFSNHATHFNPPNYTWTPRVRSGSRERFTPRVPVSPRPPIVDTRPAWRGNDYSNHRGPRDDRRNFTAPTPRPAPTVNNSTIPRLALANPLPQPLHTPLQHIPTPNVQAPGPRPAPSGSWARGNSEGHRNDYNHRPSYQAGFHAAPATPRPAIVTPRVHTATAQTHAPRQYVAPPPAAVAPRPAAAPAPAPVQNSNNANSSNGRGYGRHRAER
jgi:hypothetical protein